VYPKSARASGNRSHYRAQGRLLQELPGILRLLDWNRHHSGMPHCSFDIPGPLRSSACTPGEEEQQNFALPSENGWPSTATVSGAFVPVCRTSFTPYETVANTTTAPSTTKALRRLSGRFDQIPAPIAAAA